MYELCLLHIKKHKRLVTSAWDAVTKRKEPWEFFFFCILFRNHGISRSLLPCFVKVGVYLN